MAIVSASLLGQWKIKKQVIIPFKIDHLAYIPNLVWYLVVSIKSCYDEPLHSMVTRLDICSIHSSCMSSLVNCKCFSLSLALVITSATFVSVLTYFNLSMHW